MKRSLLISDQPNFEQNKQVSEVSVFVHITVRCFDCDVCSEMIINLRMMKTMQLILFNDMTLPYSRIPVYQRRCSS